MRFLRLAMVVIVLPWLILSLTGCGPRVKIKHQPVQFSDSPSPHGKNRYPNWQAAPPELEGEIYQQILADEFKVLDSRHTAAGTAGAEKVHLKLKVYAKDLRFKFKKVIPGKLDSFNNSPRREIAAYQIQKLFLEPEDYVVPASFVYCVPVDLYRQWYKNSAASVEGTNCVLGVASIWMVDVKLPEVLFDETRFLNEPNYAYFLSNLNIFTYLIAHRDAREGNFLVSKDEKRRQVFSIDNGESFGSWPRNYFVQNWDKILVPALRQDSIDRLRQLKRQDLDFLGVVAQLEKDEHGRLRPVEEGENLYPRWGVRRHEGTVQFGLTKSEIDDVWERIVSLIAAVDSGKIPVF